MRLDPEVRRGMILDAVEVLLAEHDPLLVPFEEVARAADVSRALVHNYFGDRRGLLDAVQLRVIARLDTWVGHGLSRATSPGAALRALTSGLFAFVDAERDAWQILVATGGIDHPALHALRARWCEALDTAEPVVGQIVVAALLTGAGGWASRGEDPIEVSRHLDQLLR